MPLLLVNFFSSFVPPILIFRQVLLMRIRTNLSSSSSMMVSCMLRRIALSIVSKAADNVMFIFSCSVLALILISITLSLSSMTFFSYVM